MKFQFEEKSKLHGRILRREVSRFSFVPKNESGLREYVLVYNERIPGPEDEPELYAGASFAEVDERTSEVFLHYDGLEEEIMLTTLDADNQFRKDNPIVVEQELFMLEE